MAASHRPIGEILDDINTDKLETTKYTDYVRHLTSQVKCCIATDGPSLILFVESLKNCPQPCFKRDTLLNVLDSVLEDDQFVVSNLLCEPFKADKAPWKELANSMISLTDLYANYNTLGRYPNLTENKFYATIISNIYSALETLSQNDGTLSREVRFYLTQCIGRVSISGHKELIWSLFTRRALNESRPGVKKLAKEILTTPIRCDSHYQFEAFIEHLYVPIFQNSDPREEQIESILSDHIKTNDALRYIICDKLIFRTNYNLNYGKQVRILLNIFTYLGSISQHGRKDRHNANLCDKVEILAIDDKQLPMTTTMTTTAEDNVSLESENLTTCLLTDTFLEIVKNWSNNTKILLRSYSHNKYITAALILGLRYTTERDHYCLMKHLDQIQSILMKALPFYLNRASSELRELAMCSGEVVFPRLHKLDNSMDLKQKQQQPDERGEQAGISSSSSRQPPSLLDTGSSGSKSKKIDNTETNVDKKTPIELDFGVKFSDDLRLLQSLIDTPIELLIKEHCMVTTPTKTTTASDNETCSSGSNKFSSKNNSEDSFSHGLTTGIEPSKQDGDSEEKRGGECGDDEDGEDDDVVGEELAKVPIYLRDCIDGLMENNNARLVRLCLIKAGELISQQYADVSTSSSIVAPPNTPKAMAMDTTTINAKTSSSSSTSSNRSLRLSDFYQLCSTSRKGNHNQQVQDGAGTRCAGCCICLGSNAISNNIGQSMVIGSGGVGGGNSISDSNYETATKYNNQSTPLTSDITAAKINHSHAPTALLIMGHQDNTTFSRSHHRQEPQQLDEKRQVASSATTSLLKSSSHSYSSSSSSSSSFFKEKSNQVSGSIKDNCLELSKLLLYLDDQFNIKHFDMYRMKAMCLLCYTEPGSVAKYLLDEFNSSNASTFIKLDIMNVLVSTAQHLSSSEYPPTPPTPPSRSSSSSSSSSSLPRSSSPSPYWSLSLSQMKTIDYEQSRRRAAVLSAKYVPMFVYGLIYGLKAEINSSPTIVWRQLKQLHQRHEMNENDSFLLSRIFFSISLLVKCLNHQPIMCKLSMDLLEVLDAYRNHLDSGVRKSIISCLIAIKHSTPKVYFENNLATKYTQMCNTLAHNSLID